MHRLFRKHREEVLLFLLLVAVGTPFLTFWIIVVDPHRPSPLATIAVCLAVSTALVLIAPALERQIQRHLDPRAHVEGPRPTNPDGTPYRYHQIRAGGWEFCDGCRMWGQGWTPDNPHKCQQTYVKGPVTDRKADR